MKLRYRLRRIVGENVGNALGLQHTAPDQEVAQAVFRRRRSNEDELSLRPIEHLPQRRANDGQIACPSLLQDVSDDHGERRDLDALQAHVDNVFNTLQLPFPAAIARWHEMGCNVNR